MKFEAAYAGAFTIASAAGTTVVAPDGPVLWNLGGVQVPVVPALIGILAALLARIIVITSPKRHNRNLRAYNISVTLLTMLAAATYITDARLGPGASFWTGLGCGAMGVALVELARSQLFEALRAGTRAAFQTFANRPRED